MNELQIFTNPAFGSVRTINDEGAALFCGSDIAKALGYERPAKAIQDHCKGVLKRSTPTAGGVQEMSFIPEGDVYRLIVRSNLPTAERFERWVFDEVLPSIRKHGMYAKEELLNNPDLLIAVATELKQEREARKALEAEKVVLLPKAAVYDALADRDSLTNFRDTAKLLNIRERAFIAALIDDGFIYRTKRDEIRPVADRNNGYFKVKEFPLTPERAGLQTMITFKGREHFLNRYGRIA